MPKTWLRSPRSPNWDDPANRAAIWNGEQVRLALPLSHIGPLSLGGLLLAAASQPSLAGCSSSSFFDPPFFPNNLLSNSTVTCFGVTTTRVGQGPGAENITLIVRDGATIGVTNTNAISLGGNVIINSERPSRRVDPHRTRRFLYKRPPTAARTAVNMARATTRAPNPG